MAFIIRRKTMYYLNLRLPKALDHRRPTFRISLGVTNRRAALYLAGRLAFNVSEHLNRNPLKSLRDLNQLCYQWLHDDSATELNVPISALTVMSTSLQEAKVEPTLESLANDYIAEGKQGGSWREGNIQEVERCLRDFFELMGDRKPSAFTSTDARTFKGLLSQCPQYFGLRPEFSGKSLRQVIDSGMQYTPISTVTVNNRLRKVSAFFNWCLQNQYIDHNPLKGMKVMVATSSKDARLSFNPSDITALLDCEALRKESEKHPWRFWLVILGRATGARMEELCQLYTDDIVTVQGVACIRIAATHQEQKLKSPSSQRLVPIHSDVVRMGFLEHVQKMNVDSPSRVFPELIPKRGQLGHAPSKWFGRYRHKRGVTDPRKVFHSFRHTFIDDLREAGVQDSIIKRLVGHEDGSMTFGLYGSREPIKVMAQAVAMLKVEIRTNKDEL
ncbi:site-specific integrase [Pseudomonas sp. W2Jun17]|nr:site-specific integrase [Pseudomonas sp. W2Jun17]